MASKPKRLEDLPKLREHIRREISLPPEAAGFLDRFTEKFSLWISPKMKEPRQK